MYKTLLVIALIANSFWPGVNLPEKLNQQIDSLDKNTKERTNNDQFSTPVKEWGVKVHPSPTKNTLLAFTPSAEASYSLDLASAKELSAKNSQTKLPIASLTKLMTAYIVLKENTLNQIQTVPKFETRAGDSLAGINPGERITTISLLRGLLINSGNDAAQALAVTNAGSISAFVNKMNQNAEDLNLTETHYTNPVGWDSVNNYSSAKDTATLARILLNNKVFREITSTKETTIYTTGGRAIYLTNTNALLGTNGFVGIKTGRTTIAGECLVALNRFNGHEVLTVIIGSTDRFGQTANFLDWIKGSFLW